MYLYKSYAGIGARNTPTDILSMMQDIAFSMTEMSWTLRSGAAHGADTAFENGAKHGNGRREIFLPWPSFNGHSSRLEPKLGAWKVAEKYHPSWDKLSQGAKRMMARNANQIMGVGMNDPVKFVCCWTPNGAVIGVTGQALRHAMDLDIPIINLGSMAPEEAVEQIQEIIEQSQ